MSGWQETLTDIGHVALAVILLLTLATAEMLAVLAVMAVLSRT